jgi:hypothetical protein
MTEPVQFEVEFTKDDDDDEQSGSFYITISDGATVYETRSAAVDEIKDKLKSNGSDAFVAKLELSGQGEDVDMKFKQVEWQKIITEMDT